MSGTRRIAAMGFGVTPPPGWETTIYRRRPAPGERTYPILHAATRPLPFDRGDYGAGLVETLGPSDVFVSLLDFGPASPGTKLFSDSPAVPTLPPDAFRPRQLQRVIAGQAGAQRFVAVAGRAVCLYAVIGSFANRLALSSRANDLITTIEVESA